MAMIFLTLLATLSVGMYAMSTVNVETAANLESVEKARTLAESGMRWIEHRFRRMSRPKTTIGNISPEVADSLWPAIRAAIATDMSAMLKTDERPVFYDSDANVLTSSPIAPDGDSGRFVITITQHPTDARYLYVTSTGMHRGATRSISMYFRIDKKIRYAIAGRVPIQLGRNVMVEGPIVMTTTAKPGNQPPVLAISDFKNINSSLSSDVLAFQQFLADHYGAYDNRVPLSDATAAAAAQAAGFSDANLDGYIDEYDLFLAAFDGNNDRAIAGAEFIKPGTAKPYDENLLPTIDTLGAPLSPSDPERLGYNDGQVDNYDGYAKVSGQVLITEGLNPLKSRLASDGKAIPDVLQGPITPVEPGDAPVVFGYDATDVADLTPDNFNTNGFRDNTGPEHGATAKTSTVISNAVLSAADANGGNVNERTPYGSTTYQATYKRPVFQNMTFKNCRIPKGLNALFDNCKFEGVTYVETEANITNSSGHTTTSSSDGMTWSKKMKSGSFSSTTALTSTNSWGFCRGNNLRFNNCTIEGPLTSGGAVGEAPTAYTHFTNSWEFTGSTLFDNKVDQTATIIAPNTNIEMGSFTNPGQAPSTLIGVVVAGNLDIRGTSIVDGSIIVTGDGAGNTTLGWFGASDSDTNASSPMPEGGWGKINIRRNPNRSLPDGINIAIDILPVVDSYEEGQ